MKIIKRDILKEFITSLEEYPVVTLVGPRQSGKTTFARKTLPNYDYCSLEDPDIREIALSDPRTFFNSYKKNLIIDEVQRVPSLLSYLQTIVDQEDNKRKFVLTGSHQLALREKITQSLAGRTAVLTLLPLSLNELKKHSIELDRDLAIYQGFYPRIYKENINATRAMKNYYQTYVEKDVRQLINLKDTTSFETFMKLLAGRVGQVLNLSSLANDIGKSSNTIKEWLSILEASFIIYRLTPYYENFGKRVIKSPKYYFVDTGLLCYLLGIEKTSQVSRDPLLGSLFENLVICEALKEQLNQGRDGNLYFFRDSHGNEIDIIKKVARNLIPIEVKAARTFNKNFAKNIIKFQKITNLAQKGIIVFAGDNNFENDVYTLKRFDNVFNEI